jgi:calcineurin-like phosphoesterase family protein
MNYYIADTHFSHKNIIKYEDRPFTSVEQMNNIMIEKWNKKVKEGDNVYILGDFAFATESICRALLSILKGNKFLIWGNHDKDIKHNKDIQRYFVWCKDYHVIYDKINSKEIPIILFHYPIQVWDRKHHGSIHLYGHIHSDKENHHPMVSNLVNAYNVGVDVNNFEPMTIQELINKYGYTDIVSYRGNK